MLSPRWRKAISDLWLYKTRTLLVLLAMILGVFGVSVVANSYSILSREMDKNYLSTNPASATIWTDPLDDKFVQTVEELPAIGDAQASRKVVGRIQVGPNKWHNISLFIIDDFSDIRIDSFEPEQGAWPPATGEILLERVALSVARAEVGNTVLVKIPDGSKRELKLVGTVHAPGLAPAWMEGAAYGFITRDTLELLGSEPCLDQLKITVAENALDKEHIRATTHQLKEWMEQSGRQVYHIEIPEPGRHPHAAQMDTLLFLLEIFGLLAFALSGILVANMISALLAQQTRQIGVMKTVGGSTRQIMGLYLVLVIFLGLVSLAVGMPLGVWAGRAYADFAAGMLNFDIFSYKIPAYILALQIAAGLLLPTLAAAYPIYRGCQTTVCQAISNYGVDQDKFGESTFDRLLGSIKGLPRTFLLSLRNTFRRRGRLILTLLTLAVGGTGFIVAMNIAASMNYTVEARINAIRYDIQLRFDRSYPVESIEKAIGEIPGVAGVEGWGGIKASRVYPDSTSGNYFNIVAPPAATSLMTSLPLVEGRWLQPGDKNALVVNQQLIAKEPDIKVGDEITLGIGDKNTTWKVVGIAKEMMAEPTAYAVGDYFAGATGQVGYAQNAVVVTTGRDTAAQKAVAQMLEQKLETQGFDLSSTVILDNLRKSIEDHLLIIAFFLLLMSVLVLLVGGLGLATTMSINILERTREIGIMRAVGASTTAIIGTVIAEGSIIGILSWFIAVALSWPVSKFVSYNFGMIFFEAPLEFVFSPTGLAIWLGVVIVFAALASFYPAWKASKQVVSEVLVYE